MKLLDKLVFKDLLPMFGVGIALFSSLWFAADPMMKAGQYLSQGFAWIIVARFLILEIPIVLSFTFPMAVVLSVLNGFGRISGESEAVALFAGGIPFARVAAPAALLGVFASFAGYVINNDIATHANKQIASLKEDAFKQIQSDKPIMLPPIIKDDKLQATVLVGKGVDPHFHTLRQVTITWFDKDEKPTVVIHAPVATWVKDDVFQLRDAETTTLGEHAFYSRTGFMANEHLNTTPKMLEFLNADASTHTFSELRRQVRELRASGYDAEARSAELTMWRLVAVPLASLVFALIGSPLGLRPQRTGKYAGWGLAVLIIFGYYVLYMVAGNMSDGGTLPPMLAAFAPDIIGLIIGTALVFRAST